MNKLITLALVLLTAPAFAQPEMFAEVRDAQRAFLTEKMGLTTTEAEAFFPIYWEEEARMRRDRQDARREGPAGRRSAYTEEQAREWLLQRRARLRQKLDRHIAAEERYLKVIPANKLMHLERAEVEFKRRLLQRMRKREN